MTIIFTDTFRKQYRKADVRIRKAFEQRLHLFKSNPMDAALRNHALRGRYDGYRSIDVNGDWRSLYKAVTFKESYVIYYFVALGTHAQLYG